VFRSVLTNLCFSRAAVLCFSVFAGIGSCFSFLATSGPLSDPTTIDALCKVAFLGVANYMEDFVVRKHNGVIGSTVADVHIECKSIYRDAASERSSMESCSYAIQI
jgi:hypothetical protein